MSPTEGTPSALSSSAGSVKEYEVPAFAEQAIVDNRITTDWLKLAFHICVVVGATCVISLFAFFNSKIS